MDLFRHPLPPPTHTHTLSTTVNGGDVVCHPTVAVAEQLQSAGIPDPALAQQLGAILGGGRGGRGGAGGAGGVGGMAGAGAGGGASVPDELAYSKKPRQVQYRCGGPRGREREPTRPPQISV